MDTPAPHLSGPADTPAPRPGLPPAIRALAWGVYMGTLAILAWAGAKIAFLQVPPRDLSREGPMAIGTRITPDSLPGYPYSDSQKLLRDYLFVVAAGQDAANYKVRFLEGKVPVEVLRYDGELVQLRIDGEKQWGPVEPLEKLDAAVRGD